MQSLITRCERDAHQHELAQHFAPLSHPLPHPGILGPERIQQAADEATRFAHQALLHRSWYRRVNWPIVGAAIVLLAFWGAVLS